ncbi:MAG TPA: hypothetical protein VNA27_04145 [Rubrobacteraceae bacterium]|nr:hypothetical protein [Rubrobacteraceae bacterium]
MTLRQSLDERDFRPHLILDVLVKYVLACLPVSKSIVGCGLYVFTLRLPQVVEPVRAIRSSRVIAVRHDE